MNYAGRCLSLFYQKEERGKRKRKEREKRKRREEREKRKRDLINMTERQHEKAAKALINPC